MKLSHPPVIKFAALLLSWWLRLWVGSLQVRLVHDDASNEPRRAPRNRIYMFWHEMMLLPAYTHAAQRITILISRHRDGELIAQVIRMLRGASIRGSTSRGGAAALRTMIRHGRLNHLAITPDGPRGPRRTVQLGAVYVASRTGMPLVPVGMDCDCWRVRSWDRMAIPLPGRRAVIVVGRPIEVPPDLDREQLEACRQQAQSAMDDVQRRAELMGRSPSAA